MSENVSQIAEHLTNILEANSCIEKTLDDLQFKKVGVAVAAATATPGSIGQCRTNQVSSSPVIELAVRNADNLCSLRATKAVIDRAFIRRCHGYSQ